VANWSVTTIKGYGKRSHQAVEAFKNGTIDFYHFNYQMRILDIETQEDSFIIEAEGRWSSPIKTIAEDIFAPFGLSGRLIDYESGSDFSTLVIVENGEIIEVKEDEYFSDFLIEEIGINYFVDYFDWIIDRDWENDKTVKEILAKFSKYGITKKELRKKYMEVA